MIFIVCSLILLLNINGLSQQKDSIKTYNLEQITVKASKQLEAKKITNVDSKDIERADASSISELAKFIPSVKVQTNSRGETQFFLRGAGERQITLFFDGVPLNTPWDNRIDLSLIPAEAIGGLNVTKGIPSVIYGANAIAGAININTKNFEGESLGKFTAQRGENNQQLFSGFYLNGNKRLSYLLTSSYKSTDGFSLPSGYDFSEYTQTGIITTSNDLHIIA